MAIEVGTKLEGKVTGITHFGAFVDLSGGVTGLVHISEIADNYVKDVNDHLKINDVVTVKVINVDKDGKIGLSIKQAVDKLSLGSSSSKRTKTGAHRRAEMEIVLAAVEALIVNVAGAHLSLRPAKLRLRIKCHVS